jgi:pimeloyl-ACP methyl ester carboxylesterase
MRVDSECAMATYVIVHGGWGGGWEWQDVARRLRTRGHEVHTPSLTGLGDRGHLATRSVGLATHVEDVVATLTSHDLVEVVLVGQSYGGMAVTGAIPALATRLARVVYLDAFVPGDGVSCNDLCGAAWTTRMRELAERDGEGWQVPFPFKGPTGLPPEVEAWYLPRMTPQPLATMEDPVDLSGGLDTSVPRTFVRFLDTAGVEQDDAISSSAQHARECGWDYQEVVAPHDLHVSDPEMMAALLDGLVDTPGQIGSARPASRR